MAATGPHRHPVLVVVTGPPAAGKTTLARFLAPRLGVPLLAKDDVKETLHDEVGPGDGSRAWSGRLGRAAYRVLHDHARRILAAGGSVMVEANFDQARAVAPLRALVDETGCRLVQLLLRVDPDTVVRRYAARAGSPERHPGHLDAVVLEEWRATPPGPAAPLDLPGGVVEVDTSDFATVDGERVFAVVRAAIAQARGR